MPTDRWHKTEEIDSSSLKVHFSPAVKQALSDLEAATHFSEHFSADIQPILRDWATGKSPTVQGALVALPLIAEETFDHVRATGDERAAKAWRELCNQMSENGFVLTKARTRDRN